jgi:hypothetical protein
MTSNNHLIGQTGFVQYYFKGMQMSKEWGVVVDQEATLITVKRDVDRQLINFVKHKNKWLLSNSLNNHLIGTEFVINEQTKKSV